jgi:hypothetical protein
LPRSLSTECSGSRVPINKVYEFYCAQRRNRIAFSMERASTKRVHPSRLLVSLPPMPDERRAIGDAGGGVSGKLQEAAARSERASAKVWRGTPSFGRGSMVNCSAGPGARLPRESEAGVTQTKCFPLVAALALRLPSPSRPIFLPVPETWRVWCGSLRLLPSSDIQPLFARRFRRATTLGGGNFRAA